MKRVLALLLVALMVLSSMLAMVACGNDKDKDDKKDDGKKDNTEKAEFTSYVTDFDNNTVDAGSMTAVKGSSAGGEVSYDKYQGVTGKDYTDPAYYTFNDYYTSTATLNWNALTWETSEDSGLLGYLSSGFYNFALNADKDGWCVTTELASEAPVDVTAQYVGKYGIEAGDTAKAWKLTLNPLAKWNDGTLINADSYIYSYKELLDPLMKCRRADSLYAGDFSVYGAKNYFYQGQEAFSAIGITTSEYLAAGAVEDLYVDCWGFWGAEGYVDAAGNEVPQYISVLDEVAYSADGAGDDEFTGAALYAYFAPGGQYESYSPDYLFTKASYEANYSWDNVGIIKTGEYEIVYITNNTTADANYYVPYNLSSAYLVKEDLWEACKTYYNANGDKVEKGSADVASITTNYGTSVETTASFGPYMMTYFEADKQITFERNDNWYGYHDGKHLGSYQADKISITVLNTHATQILAFEKGELDNVGLQADDMTKYGTSDYVRYTPQSYTTKLTFNTDSAKCEERGTLVLTNANFRKAIALAIDTETFASTLTTGSAGYGILNTLYVYDPFSGANYRSTDGAKEALVQLYGLTYGEGHDYATLDEAYEALTGYDVTTAVELMKKAYDELKAAGKYNDEAVELELRVNQNDEIYVKMYTFISNAIAAATKGTAFEGKITLKMTADADYYDTMYSGNTDMIFTTWGGAAYSPYTILYECYCDAADGSGNQMEIGFDTAKISVTIEVDGVDYTAPLQKWALWADSSDDTCVIKSADGTKELAPFNDYDAATKAAFYGKLEYAYLSFFVTTPIYYRSSASLISQKGDYAVSQYLDLVGFGGLEFYTFNYDDAAWAAYLAQGTLKY